MLQITKKQAQQKVELYRTIRKRLFFDIEYLTYSIDEALACHETKKDANQLIKELKWREKAIPMVIAKLAKYTDWLQCKIKIERRFNNEY